MKNSNPRLFKATSIGLIASQVLSKDQDAQVFGNTSRGLFIKTAFNWLVFLSFEQFRGPLTLTLAETDPAFRQVAPGDQFRICATSIFVPVLDIIITSKDDQIWQPLPPSVRPLDDAERQVKLVKFAKEIISKKGGMGLAPLIPALLGVPGTHRPLEINNRLDWGDFLQVQKYVCNRDVNPLARLLSTLMGSGTGLTPSADDFIVGLLLALNRWHNLLWDEGRLRDLNQKVVEAAYKKTTMLSANLIECAALGLADERLVNALDWLMTGFSLKLEIETAVADELLGWGHSSGVDAFVGMAAALHVN